MVAPGNEHDPTRLPKGARTMQLHATRNDSEETWFPAIALPDGRIAFQVDMFGDPRKALEELLVTGDPYYLFAGDLFVFREFVEASFAREAPHRLPYAIQTLNNGEAMVAATLREAKEADGDAQA